MVRTTYAKDIARVASLNTRGKLVANAQELGQLLKRKQIDILGAQEVKSHLPCTVSGYEWIPGLDRFLRPGDHLGIGFLVKKQMRGLVSVAHLDEIHEFMWIKLAGHGSVQDTFICNAYCLTMKHPVETRKAMYAALLESCTIFMAKGEVLLIGDFNARLGHLSGDHGDISSNGKLLLTFLRSAFADGEDDNFVSLLNNSFDCKGLPTREERGSRTIIDYLITSPESLYRVKDVHVQCHKQADGANALGSDHHLLFVDWDLAAASPPEDLQRTVWNYLELEKQEVSETYERTLEGELQS